MYIEKVVAECEKENFNFFYSDPSLCVAHTQLTFTTPHLNCMQKYQI